MKDFPVPDYTSKFAPSYWELVGDWFRRVGGAYLRSVDTMPDALDLADWLMEEARRREPRGLYPGTGYLSVKGMADEDLVTRAEGVAQWLLDTFKPKQRFSRESAAKGGRISRRPKVLLKAYAKLLQRLAETGEVLTAAEIAEELGCRRTSVYRLQKQLVTTALDLAPTTDTDDFVAEVVEELEPVSEAVEARITTMVERMPDTVPTTWVEVFALAEREREERERRVTVDDFQDLEV